MRKLRRDYLDDYAAQEASLMLTAIVYTRTNASDQQWAILRGKIAEQKCKIFGL
jgi:hypothetical protein